MCWLAVVGKQYLIPKSAKSLKLKKKTEDIQNFKWENIKKGNIVSKIWCKMLVLMLSGLKIILHLIIESIPGLNLQNMDRQTEHT